jgi:hypothetical protein
MEGLNYAWGLRFRSRLLKLLKKKEPIVGSEDFTFLSRS